MTEYIPYVFQVLAQMLDLHTADVPSDYRSLLPFLLQPAIWQQKGSVPGLVKLLKAFLARDSQQMVASGQIASVLGILQQRLIPSKVNDAWGFQLLQSVVQHVSPYVHFVAYVIRSHIIASVLICSLISGPFSSTFLLECRPAKLINMSICSHTSFCSPWLYKSMVLPLII